LSSIPVLGNLFRYQTDSITKKELVIIITPSVVTTKAEGETFSNEFLGKLKEVKKYLTEKEMIYTKPGSIVSPSSQTEGQTLPKPMSHEAVKKINKSGLLGSILLDLKLITPENLKLR